MGTWADAPWDNDSAADWFGDLFAETQLAERVAETLRLDVHEHHQEIRAAASLLIFLGRTHVWPVKHLHDHLQLATSKLEQMATMPDAGQVLPVDAVRAEAALLRSQMKAGSELNAEPLESAWRDLRSGRKRMTGPHVGK
jgi:hypothetical protein